MSEKIKNRAELDAIPAALRDFAAYKSVIQGCSERTVAEYSLDLRTFFRFVIAKKEGVSTEGEEFLRIDISGLDIAFFEGITSTDIYEFLLYAGRVRKNEWAAKARKLSSLKAFFKYLHNKQKLISSNPTADIESPKKHSALPKYLTLEESLSLLEAIKADKNSKTVKRDYAIATIFLNCGIRLSELVSININDVDKDLRSMRVLGKGNKERIIYLNDACRAAISDYFVVRPEHEKEKGSENALFLSSTRKGRISNKTVQWMIYKYLDAAGLGNRGFSVHKLRHTAATLMYQSGKVDVRVLRDILGHEQLNTTQIYTHVSDKNMEDAMGNNPLAKITHVKKKERED